MKNPGGGTVFQPGDTIRFSVLVSNDVTSSEGIINVVFTDILPSGVTASASNFSVDYGTGPQTLTVADDSDEGSIVNGVVTVALNDMPVDTQYEVSFDVVIDSSDTGGTLSNTASLSYDGEISGGSFNSYSNTVNVDYVVDILFRNGFE